MKKLILSIFFIFSIVFVYGQRIIDANRVIVRDSINLNGEEIKLSGSVNGDVIQRIDGSWTNNSVLLFDSIDYNVNNNGYYRYLLEGIVLDSVLIASGASTDHAILTNLSWATSGHTGTASTIAAFDGTGATTNITPSSYPVSNFMDDGTYLDAATHNAAGLTTQYVGTTNIQTLTNKTLTTPTISDYTNATHTHSSNASGGLINSDNITQGTTNLFNQSHTGDVTGATALTIGADKVLESMLKVVNAPTDEYALTYESTTGDFEWQAMTAGLSIGGSSGDIQYNSGGTNLGGFGDFNGSKFMLDDEDWFQMYDADNYSIHYFNMVTDPSVNHTWYVGWQTSATTKGIAGGLKFDGANNKVLPFSNTTFQVGGLRDNDGDLGTSGQVLSTTGSVTNWIDPPSGGGDMLLSNFDTDLDGDIDVTAGGTNLDSYTTGDLIYASGIFALSKLGIGTSGYVLKSNGSAPYWAAESGGSSLWTASGSDIYFNTGNVGIGTTSPSGILHTQTSSFSELPLYERDGRTSDIIYSTARCLATKTTNMSDGFGSSIGFHIKDDAGVINNIGYIGAERAGADDTGDIVFMPSISGTGVEKMRLSSIGDLTIVGKYKLNDANTYLDEDGSSNLTFTDAITGTKTLAELAASGASGGWTDGGSYLYPTNGEEIRTDVQRLSVNDVTFTATGVSTGTIFAGNGDLQNIDVGDGKTTWTLRISGIGEGQQGTMLLHWGSDPPDSWSVQCFNDASSTNGLLEVELNDLPTPIADGYVTITYTCYDATTTTGEVTLVYAQSE